MASYLIPYKDPNTIGGHIDPMLNEFTYGNLGINGRKLMKKIKPNDYIFFHITIGEYRYITSYYKVKEVIPAKEAQESPTIKEKYKNPHLYSTNVSNDNVIAFGYQDKSRILKRPLKLSPDVLNKLSRKPNLNSDQTLLAAISSALRAWKELDDKDVQFLLGKINKQ